jgi:hypothetical protein
MPANYAGQGTDYTGYTNASVPVALTASLDTFRYIDKTAAIIVRAAAEFLNPATQYNLGVVWTPQLAGRLDAGQSASGTDSKPAEQWT